MPGADSTTRERILEFRLKLHLRLRNSWAEVKTLQPESLCGARQMICMKESKEKHHEFPTGTIQLENDQEFEHSLPSMS